GQLNPMKGGLLCADILNTVSERYSKEIQTAEYGCGLEAVLQSRKEDLYGVLNGIDYDIWSPSSDADIARNYDYETIDGKKDCKEALQKTLGLSVRGEIPLISMVSRLDPGKGFDILAEGVHDIMKLDVQFALLGTGRPQYHEMFENIASEYYRRMSVNLKFDAKLARQIYAGADIFLMPSRYEPCGLGQMISLAYGTIPIVRSVGGLADTISDFDPESGTGNGFVFKEYSAEQLVSQVKKAVETFKNREVWGKLIKNAMDSDFSWDVSARQYVELYKKAVAKYT
ncbi:MAG: glycogen synthase, partial [Candidatus Poribacteria bacterium]